MFYGRSMTMPDASPIYDQVPINYKGYRQINVFFKADPEAIRKSLPSPFTPIGDLIQVFCMNNLEVDGLDPYMEGGIVIPCSFEDINGSHVAYEYVTSDDSLTIGREIWGYPKKLVSMTFEEEDNKISSTITRRGTTLISIDFEKDKGVVDFKRPNMQPRLQLKRFVRADGQGYDMDYIVKNELTGAHIHERYLGKANVTINGSDKDPIGDLKPLEIVGAEFVVADFVLGFAKIIKEKY